MGETLLEYLLRQRDERAAILTDYYVAKEAYEAAKEKLDSFGDVSPIEGDIAKLDGFIREVLGQDYESSDTVSEPKFGEACETSNETVEEREEA